MNLYRLNLNLLKVFSVLMRERNVSATAKALYLTQPAISNSLQQLRELFQDDLLVRHSQNMVPTKKALLLAGPINQALSQLETSLFYTDDFDCKTSTRIFNLGITDPDQYMILPKLYERIKKIAPHVLLKIRSANEFTAKDFEEQQLDLGIGVEKTIPKQLIKERLFAERSVCIARMDHPIFKQPLTLERYLQFEHLVTCVHSEEPHRADKALKKLNLQRNITLTLTNALPALQILANSDLVGTFSINFARQVEKNYRLRYQDIPLDIPEFYIAQYWHRQQANDHGLSWLRALIKTICQEHFSLKS